MLGWGVARPPRNPPSSKKRSGSPPGRRRKRHGSARPSTATSHPTGRKAIVTTRAWLLKQYGPVCAYCGNRFTARVMTLDHVAPRRGLTAYDRRDNLVLACPACNALKRDMAPLAFLLARRSRAASLLKYGAHLSSMLIDLARSLVPGAKDAADAAATRAAHLGWSALDDDTDGR